MSEVGLYVAVAMLCDLSGGCVAGQRVEDGGETARPCGWSRYYTTHYLFQTADEIQLTHSAAESERTMGPHV